jgi:hypothetical protein
VRTRCLQLVSLSALLWVLALGTPFARATGGVLQNDGFSSGSGLHCQSGLTVGDTVGAAYAAPPADYPIQVTGLQLLVCGTTSASVHLAVYADALDSSASPDAPIWSSSGSYALAPSEGFNEVDLSDQSIVVPSGGFRVAVVEDGSDAVALATDDDGGIVAQRNFVYTPDLGWNFAETLGITHDWIVRAQYESLPGPKPDAAIRRSTDHEAVGEDVYENPPVTQVSSWSAKRNKTRTFVVSIGNDGAGTGPVTVEGCASTSKFKIAYFADSADVTADVTGGTYSTGALASGQKATPLELRAKPKKPKGTLKCNVTATGGGEDDAVQAKLKAKG